MTTTYIDTLVCWGFQACVFDILLSPASMLKNRIQGSMIARIEVARRKVWGIRALIHDSLEPDLQLN